MSSPRSFRLRALALAGLCISGSGARAAAQLEPVAAVASELRTECRAGQTFVTWREIAGASRRYRVYRAQHPLRLADDLADADFLGEVDDKSSRNQGRSLASGHEFTWVIAPGGAPLDEDQGLFVYTVEGQRSAGRLRARQLDPELVYYAVTSVVAGSENRILVPGANASARPLRETPAPPEPVLQSSGSDGLLYGHWVSDRDTPYQAALSPWPSRGFDFLLQPGSAHGPHGLVLSLHAAGQTYAEAWPHRFEVPNDVDVLKLSDLVPYTSWSFWFGSQELLPGEPTTGTRVWNFTEERILWTLDAVAALLGAEHDPERVYVIGGSMGAIGGMYLLEQYPERFAAALLRNGLYDLEATDYRNPGAFERVFGAFSLGLRMRDGLSLFERTNAAFMAAHEPGRDWPVIRTINGRNDETVGWMSAIEMMHGLAAAGRPAVHYFDERTHNPNGHWSSLERALIARTCLVRRDRPSLRFDRFSLDDRAGEGERTDGDEIGAINAYLEYDATSAHASETRLDFEVYLRHAGVLDDTPAPRATVVLTPCRTGAFRPAPGEAVQFTQLARGVVVDEHLLFPDELGRVHTPSVKLERARRACRFERGTPATRAPLFLGAAPTAGEAAQAVLRGRPGEAWTMLLRLGALGPGSTPFVAQGVLDARGLSDVALPLPRNVPDGTPLFAQAMIGGRPTALVEVRVQGAFGKPPSHIERH